MHKATDIGLVITRSSLNTYAVCLIMKLTHYFFAHFILYAPPLFAKSTVFEIVI
jgi:hypothetical protein